MNQPTKPDNADFARFSPCCSEGVATMMSNPNGSYVLLKDALADRAHRPAVTGSVDTPEFLGRVIAAASEAMSEGQGREWESLIAHINALIATAAPRDVDAPIVLPEKPEPTINGTVYHEEHKICYTAPVHYTDDQMDDFATAAVQKDRATLQGQTK